MVAPRPRDSFVGRLLGLAQLALNGLSEAGQSGVAACGSAQFEWRGIEEPENGLTPPSIRAIYKTMQDFVDGAHSDTPGQLIISSHSPYLVCEAWNGAERDFIYQMRPHDGRALVRRFADIVTHHKIQLEKDSDGRRTRLNLRNAELIVDGYLS